MKIVLKVFWTIIKIALILVLCFLSAYTLTTCVLPALFSGMPFIEVIKQLAITIYQSFLALLF